MHDYHLLIHLPNNLPSTQESTSPSHAITHCVPRALFQALPSHTPRSTTCQNALFNPQGKDYRQGPVRIDWVDFEPAASGMKAKEREDIKSEPRGRFFSYVRWLRVPLKLTHHVYRPGNGQLYPPHEQKVRIDKPSRGHCTYIPGLDPQTSFQ